MTIAIPQSNATLALDLLFDRIVAGVAQRLEPAPNCVFGWNESTKQINQGTGGGNRIVLQPGDASGKVGDLDSAKLPGRDPPPVATMVELATIFLWSYDPSASDQRTQWRACRRLHDVVIPICIRTFRGRWKQLSKTWLRTDLERSFGAEMQIVFAVEAMIPDDLVPQAPGGTVTTINQTITGGGAPVPC
jgi:hypothetical protein